MPAFAFPLIVLIVGGLIGLVIGLLRRHGLARTLLDIVVAGLAAVAFVLLWIYGLGAIPALRDAINSAGRSYPYVGSAVSILTLLVPVVGAAIGVWIVSRLRRGQALAA